MFFQASLEQKSGTKRVVYISNIICDNDITAKSTFFWRSQFLETLKTLANTYLTILNKCIA